MNAPHTSERAVNTDDAVRPLVSVCLMTYNGAATVERALRSLLAQTYRPIEIIISDDHSQDDTLVTCEKLAEGRSEVRFVRPESNLGAQINMRFALSHARGKYYVWASQDDYWYPNFLESLVAELESGPPGAICATGHVLYVMHEDANQRHIVQFKGRDRPERQTPLGLAVAILTKRSREGMVWQGKRLAKSNIYIHGVWNRAYYNDALAAFGTTFSNERQVICQLALAGGFRYVDELLFEKTFYRRKLIERRSADDPTIQSKRAQTRWRYLTQTIGGIIRSPNVPAFRKVKAIPVLFASYLWYSSDTPEIAIAKCLRRLLPSSQYERLRRLYVALRSMR